MATLKQISITEVNMIPKYGQMYPAPIQYETTSVICILSEYL